MIDRLLRRWCQLRHTRIFNVNGTTYECAVCGLVYQHILADLHHQPDRNHYVFPLTQVPTMRRILEEGNR